MAEKIWWHIGLPKTGTTYLQEILWANRDALAAEGITLPLRNHRRMLWAALDLMGNTRLANRHPEAPGSWSRLCDEIDAVDGTVLLSHEFFCGATAEQVNDAMGRLAPAEVHVVITARDAAGMLGAGWQEHVKNGGTSTLREVAGLSDPAEFGWWVWDLGAVLERWIGPIPADHVHVLPIPERSEGPDKHWRNFADTIGFTSQVEVGGSQANPSLGVVQAEALRRVNQHLQGFGKPVDRGQWIRGFLGEQHLAAQEGDRVRLDDDLFDDCRARSAHAVELIEQAGVRVVGSVDRVAVAPEKRPGRTVDSVSADEIGDVLAELVSSLLHDVRDLSKGSSDTISAGETGASRRIRKKLRSVIPSGRTDRNPST